VPKNIPLLWFSPLLDFFFWQIIFHSKGLDFLVGSPVQKVQFSFLYLMNTLNGRLKGSPSPHFYFLKILGDFFFLILLVGSRTGGRAE